MNHIIAFHVGDDLEDSPSAEFIILSNLTRKEIIKAQYNSKRILGFDCTRYADETNILHKNDVDILLTHGFEFPENEKFNDDGSYIFKYCDELEVASSIYFKIYLFCIKLGNPEFDYKLVDNESMYIGGAGLFDD